MSDSLESALIIQLAGTLQWSAAIPPVNRFTGTLTGIDPGQPLDITQYSRRDREFQHRDMVNSAAVAKVSIFARTVWNGTVVQPVLQGVTGVTDSSGTNVTLPLDPSQVGTLIPNTSTAVQYVLNGDVPYAAVQVTDVNLYNRDLMLFETLARAAALFSTDPPISRIDPSGVYIGATSVWATAQGTNQPKVPNAAEPMNQATFKEPDLYLAERDNQVAAYVARVAQALQNPFEYAARIYVQINAASAGNSQESETYVLTDNRFVVGNTYTAGEQVLYLGVWYEAIVTTTDIPPSANWTTLSAPTQLQFLGDPSLDSRNRIVYSRIAKTLQWFRETLDLVHVPQIVGFFVPGILPGQSIQTVPAVPEQKDAQFYRQKAARVVLAEGTFQSQQVFDPTANRDSSATYVTGGLNTLFQDLKHVTLPIPDSIVVNFQNLICTSGTYAMDCLVRPSPNIDVAGGDNDQGSVDTSDGGTTYSAIGDIRNWEVALPAGGWKLFIDFANASATPTTAFGVKATQGATSILASTLPLYYTDSNSAALPQNTVISSPGIDLQSTGQVYNFSVQWTAGSGLFHVKRLRFQQVNGPDTSHYIMQAAWINAASSVADMVIVPGGDAQGVTPAGDGGVDFPAVNTPVEWLISLNPGSWQMVLNYSNLLADGATKFDISISQPGLSPQSFTLPYTDGTNVALPADTIATSQSIGVTSNGQTFTLGIQWLPPGGGGPPGRFHVRDLTFSLLSSQNSVSKLDVIGQANMADVMPFKFFLAGSDLAPQIQITWLPKSASVWQSKPYNPGDQVLYNLVYWQATAITTATDIPGQSSKWNQLGIEPQIPLLFEQIQLAKYVGAATTPEVVGFQGFRQDMLERALRCDKDAYTLALKQVGTNFPEFRDTADVWSDTSTGSWMSFLEVYEPRLRQATDILSGNIVPGRQYEVITQAGESVIYNSVTYSNGQKFYGVSGVATYTTTGQPVVNQVGAYVLSSPNDIGKTGLIPAGIEFVRTAGTGTVHGWYPSYASYPTHQAIQPWMIERGFYVADDDFQSPDGNVLPTSSATAPAHDNPPPPHLSLVFVPEDSAFAISYSDVFAAANGLVYVTDGINFWSTTNGLTFTTLGSTAGIEFVESLIFAAGQFVGVGSNGYVTTSPNAISWTDQVSAVVTSLHSVTYGLGRFVAVGDLGGIATSTNGTSWSDVSIGGSDTFNQVIFANNIFVAVGDAGIIYTSTNGTVWTAQTSGTTDPFQGVTYGLGKFVAVTGDNSYISTDNGVSWIPHPFTTFSNVDAIDFGGNLFVIGASNGPVYSSKDAINWSLADDAHSAVSASVFHYTGAVFMIGQQSPPT
jgi:hypothetical protein